MEATVCISLMTQAPSDKSILSLGLSLPHPEEVGSLGSSATLSPNTLQISQVVGVLCVLHVSCVLLPTPPPFLNELFELFQPHKLTGLAFESADL